MIPNDDVQVKVIRRTWDYIRQKGMDGYWTWQTTTNDEEIQTLALRSKSSAQSAKWTPEQGGLYILQATAKDEAGRTSQTEMEVYVAGSGASWARGDSNKVELVPDKRSYEPGDVAKILVKSPRPGMKALVTVEREGIRQQEVLTLSSTAEVIEVQVAEDAIPNLYVSVILVEGAPPIALPMEKFPTGIWAMPNSL